MNSTFGLNVDLLESGLHVLVAFLGPEDDWSVLKKEGAAHSGRTDSR